MAQHLYIAGVDRWPPADDILSIEQALTYEIDTCSFHVAGTQPSEGDEVIIEDDDIGRMFAGIIVKVELVDKDLKIWSVDCDDYTALIDRKLVVETYENMSASDIFLDIVAKYCPDFTVNGVQSGAPTVEATGIEFDYKHPSECFRWLCDYVGWHWQPDYYTDLQFFSAEALASPAPMTLVPGGKFRFGKHSIDTQGLRNRVYVRGGTMLSDPQTVQWKADGVARIWTLPWPPHDVSLKVGEVGKTVGVENLHDEANYDYMMSFTEKYIRCSAQTVTPVAGTTMALTAKQDIPVITMVEDYAGQVAIAAVQGGDGVYEHDISDDTLSTIQAAEAAGMADLREHANPRVKGSFETEYVVPAVYGNVYVGEEIVGHEQVGWQISIEQDEADDGSVLYGGQGAVAQSFLATSEMAGANKTKVSLMSWGKGPLFMDTYWYVYTDDGGAPGVNLSPDGYGVVTGEDWPGLEEWVWVEAEIELDAPLADNAIYWLVIKADSNVSSDYYVNYLINTSTSDYYEDGYLAYMNMDGNWVILANWDLVFKVDVPTYEPVYGPVYGHGLVSPTHTWQPGQIVDVRLPDRGVTGEYLIQRVTISPTWSNPSIWTYRVEYGGRILGIADFLKALVSSQQKKRNIEPSKSIQKYVYGEETLELKDELYSATRALPYVCGDPDAVCGMVVVSNG